MSLLEIDGLTHSFGENVLYKNAGFTLNKGEHIGIVGQNGTGKSTLIKICTEQIIPDSGRIVWQPNTTVGYLDQYAEIDHSLTMKEFLKSAFSKLFDMEAQAMELYEKAADGDMKSLELAAHYQEQLEAHDFYSIDTAIERVANGLGLLAIGLDRSIAEMSGGQRAKVILAKLLLEKPDVLLLDEPTNFLDKDHVTWLAEYLSALENAFLVVSHDYGFLDKIANRICDIDNDTITKYYGTYSEFLRKKTLLREDYVRQYAAQQKEIKKTEEDRKNQLLMDHSEMLSRLIIFLGAGMSIRTAWDKIAEDYKRAVNEGRSEMHYVYEEMYITGSQLKSGISEAKAFAEFGTRCGLQQYMKLSGLLEQNRKNGSKNLRETLRLEMAEAFEQRKHQARRMGEKAGTKLLVPLFLLLGVVMVMIMLPAWTAFG